MPEQYENEWTLIKNALENPKYKWRTLNGVAKETGLDPNTIKDTINLKQYTIVASAAPAPDGSELFTTRDHYREKSTIWERFENAVINRVYK